MSIPSTSKTDIARGYPIGLLSALLLSTTAPFIRYLTVTYRIPPLVLAFWRDGLAVVTLLLILAVAYPALLRGVRQHLSYLVAFGLVMAAFNSMWTISVALNGAAVATVLAYSSAGFTALLGWWLLKEHLDWVKLVAVALSLGGCVLVSGALAPEAWHANVMGIATGILTGLCYASYSLMGRSAAQRGLNPWTSLFYTFAFATGFLLLVNLVPGGVVPGMPTQSADLFWLGGDVMGWGVLFVLAAGPTLGGFGIYNVSLSYLPSSVANLIVTSEPIFTAVIAYFLLGERLTLMQLGGGVMILAGVLFLRLYGLRSPDRAVNPAVSSI